MACFEHAKSNMLRALLRRVALSLLTLVMLATFVFLATEVLPGDALDVTLSADEMSAMPPQRLAAMKTELGLDRPVAVRLGEFLWGLAHFDLGRTLISKVAVSQIIAYPMRNSLLLATTTLLFALPLAVLLGVCAAYAHRRSTDKWVSTLSLIGYSVPEFVTGTFLVMWLAVSWAWFPATITADTRATAMTLLQASPLVVLTLLIGSIAYLTRLLRVGMVDALSSDFVERLRLTGVPEWRIVWRHALPAAAIPTLSAMALYAAALVSGIVVVELVFSYPGVGQELVRAISKREVHVIQAIAITSAAIVVAMNFLADIAILALDPRTRQP